MIVLGGRTNNVGENVQMEVYETESSEWKKFTTLQRFRHTIWSADQFLYMHGGFENETPNIPTNSIVKIDLLAVFKGNAILLGKLEAILGPGGKRGDAPGSSRPGSTNNSDNASSGSKSPLS